MRPDGGGARMNEPVRLVVDLFGVVQGVGFRPALYQLACAAGLGGWVQNRSDRVRLALEGMADEVEGFVAGLSERLPPLARVDRVVAVTRERLRGAPAAFAIRESAGGGPSSVTIPADIGMCGDCERELRSPQDRRFGYAFTTCTNCGPRYTVVTGMPYDRERTTLAAFPLCPACEREYRDPGNRRFHAESTCCPECGPRLWLLDCAGAFLGGEPIRMARAALAEGAVVAVRGIGGFLLAADAMNGDAVRRLRERKRRPDKPFAVMAASVAAVRRVCLVSAAAAAALASPERPIVVLEVAAGSEREAALGVLAPDGGTLGVMLPTSPLHELLLAPLPGDPTPPFELLVMTSGNRGGEPICLGNREAVERLAGIADRYLCHDREIRLRNDDSLVVMQGDRAQVWRRGRGYAPNPVRLGRPLARCVLAMGAHLKNTIAVGEGQRVVVSPHVGDLDTPEAVDGLEQVSECLPRFLGAVPEVVAVDLHPDYHSSRLGRRIAAAAGVPVVAVPHHHAHALACMAEHGVEEALALVFDGTGLGDDGAIWGAELLAVDGVGADRLATFRAAPLPGGDAAVREPRRQAVARMADAGAMVTDALRLRWGVSEQELAVWRLQLERGVNCPMTHAAGRLFDGVAAVLGVAPVTATYDGQAAIRLEAAAARGRRRGGRLEAAFDTAEVAIDVSGKSGRQLMVDWRPLFRRLAKSADPDVEAWAMALHRAVAEAAAAMACYGLDRVGARPVALTGGVFMNRILTELLRERLAALGVTVLLHAAIPPNDGGIALGQVLAAGAR